MTSAKIHLYNLWTTGACSVSFSDEDFKYRRLGKIIIMITLFPIDMTATGGHMV